MKHDIYNSALDTLYHLTKDLFGGYYEPKSERGRTITHAIHIRLTDGEWNLPKIKGSDDAEKAQWVPLGKVRSEEMFDDHFDIIQYFLGVH